jgi:hypothetical protein
MRRILVGAGACDDQARTLIAKAIEAAVRFRLGAFLHTQAAKAAVYEQEDANFLTRQLRVAADFMDKLPPTSKGELNKVLSSVDWEEFDCETFIFIIRSTLQALSRISPACKAEATRDELIKVSPSLFHALGTPRERQRLMKSVPDSPPRTARHSIIEIWERLVICRDLEAAVRSDSAWRKSRVSLAGFFKHAAAFVEAKQAPKLLQCAALQTYMNVVWTMTERLVDQQAHFKRGKAKALFERVANCALSAVRAEPLSKRQMRAFLLTKDAVSL